MNSFSYLCYFYYYALRGMLRKQNLQLANYAMEFSGDFVLTARFKQAWQQLFAVTEGETAIPFFYYWIEYEKFFLQAMDKLRFKFQNVLHLGQEIIFSRANPVIAVGEKIKVTMQVSRIQHLERDRAVVYFVSAVQDAAGQEIIRCTDQLFLKGLTAQDVLVLKKSSQPAELINLRKLSTRKPALANETAKIAEFHVPAHFGAKYGKVSGDFNPVHTRTFAAKAFGYRDAFLQGSATVNFLMKEFFSRGMNLRFFNIQFCKPIFMQQTIAVYVLENQFELIDADGKLVAFGKIEHAAK